MNEEQKTTLPALSFDNYHSNKKHGSISPSSLKKHDTYVHKWRQTMRVILMGTMIMMLTTFSQAEERYYSAPATKEKADFLEGARKNCEACHPDHHANQIKLLTGDITEAVPKTPGLMSEVNIDCMGCHIETKFDKKGEKVVKATSKACVGCHTDRHESMAEEWKDIIKEELEAAEEMKRNAENIVKKAHDKTPVETLVSALARLEKGQELLNVVKYGYGIHNKKYSIMLIDFALDSFEDAIDLVHGAERELNAMKE